MPNTYNVGNIRILSTGSSVFHCKEIRITFVCSDFVVGNLSLIVCHTFIDDSNLCTRIALGGERVHVKLDNWHLLTVSFRDLDCCFNKCHR